LNVIEKDCLMQNAVKVGSLIRDRFKEKLAKWLDVIQIRGQGLMLGVELPVPCGELVKEALKHRLLINVTSERVVRLLPALVMNQAEAEEVVDTASEIIEGFLVSQPESVIARDRPGLSN
jgi:acetylornithine aminotransferase